MDSISNVFADDHRHCDEVFVAIEQAVAKGDWARAKIAVGEFVRHMERHFGIEEDQLFPALQHASLGAQGPVQVMLMEHEQMRGLFARLQTTVEQQDKQAALDASETLLMIMQQHNMKEEGILYPMADQLLAAKSSELSMALHQA